MSWLLPPMLPNHQAALRDVRARSHQARLAAAQRLGMADGSQREDAAEGLRTLLDDRDPRVVAASLESLTQLAPTGAAAWIARALGASRADLREQATLALAACPDPEAVALLREATRCEHPEVRFQALAALLDRDRNAATDDLLAARTDTDPEVRGQAASLLCQTGDPRAADALTALLDDLVPRVRLQAAVGLAQLGDQRALDELRSATTEPSTRLDAAQGLARLDHAPATEALHALLERKLAGPAVHATAAAGLAARGDLRGQRRLDHMVRSWRRSPSLHAVLAATALAGPRMTLFLARVSVAGGRRSQEAFAGLCELAADPARQRQVTLLSGRQDNIGRCCLAALEEAEAAARDGSPP